MNLATHRTKLRTGGGWTAAFLSEPAKTPWYQNKEMSNLDITRTNRLLIGHANNRLFQFRMKKAISPVCRYCDDPNSIESIKHIILECRRYRTLFQRALDGRSIADVLADVGQAESRVPKILECFETAEVQI